MNSEELKALINSGAGGNLAAMTHEKALEIAKAPHERKPSKNPWSQASYLPPSEDILELDNPIEDRNTIKNNVKDFLTNVVAQKIWASKKYIALLGFYALIWQGLDHKDAQPIIDLTQSESGVESNNSQGQAKFNAVQAQVDTDIEAYMAECFSKDKKVYDEAECRQKHDVNDLNRSIPFTMDRPTVVYLDFGHGLGEPGASYIKLKGDPSYYGSVFGELSKILVEKNYVKNEKKALSALRRTRQEMMENQKTDDGYFNLVYVSQELYENLGKPKSESGASLRYKIENTLLAYMREKKLALSEQDIVSKLGHEITKRLRARNIAVALSHTGPQDNPLAKDEAFRSEKDALRAKALGVRAGLSRALSEKYNIITISLHADSIDDPTVERTALYIQSSDEKIPSVVARAFQKSWTQGGSHNVTSNKVDKHNANLAMAGKVVNGGLLETFQLGNYAGRVRAYNMMVNEQGAMDVVAGSAVTAITNSLDTLNSYAYYSALMAAPLEQVLAQSQDQTGLLCRPVLGEVQPRSFLKFGA